MPATSFLTLVAPENSAAVALAQRKAYKGISLAGGAPMWLKPLLVLVGFAVVCFGLPLLGFTLSTEFRTIEYISGVLALATASVAVLAVWGERIRQFIGPILRIQLVERDPEELRDPTKWIFHLEVRNQRRAAPARNAYVVITEIRREGSSKSEYLPGPLKIPWYFGQPDPTIGPANTCDLGIKPDGANLFLSPQYKPYGYSKGACRIEAGKRVHVRLQARSENGDSKEYCIRIYGRQPPVAEEIECKSFAVFQFP